MKRFFGFLLLSGLGWLCDFASFTVLVKVFGVPGATANFVSSYVGVSFVWFTSLGMVFKRTRQGQGRFLLTYWSYQFVSILVYSQCLRLVAEWLSSHAGWPAGNHSPAILAKIVITPFNLLTNFLFMKYLTRFMRDARSSHA